MHLRDEIPESRYQLEPEVTPNPVFRYFRTPDVMANTQFQRFLIGGNGGLRPPPRPYAAGFSPKGIVGV